MNALLLIAMLFQEPSKTPASDFLEKENKRTIHTQDSFPSPGVIVRGPGCKVVQVLDENSFIAELIIINTPNPTRPSVSTTSKREYVIRGVDTKNLADNDRYKFKYALEIVGKEKFDGGETMHVLQELTKEDVEKRAEKEKAAK
jgi:hypothetical protein